MSEPVTDNIDRLQLHSLRRPLGWTLMFRSGNDGMFHQLYVNGRLTDFTDTAAQRFFAVSATSAAIELAVVAVPPEGRFTDFSASLPEPIRQPPWVYRAPVVRHIDQQPGDNLAVYHDSAGGTVSDDPALLREYWPRSFPHWGWGLCEFGRGGFGIDGSGAPGLGGCAFGLGPFGVGADFVPAELALGDEGTHQVELRTLSAAGRESEKQEDTFCAHPPPAPLGSIAAGSYDPQTHQLTLQFEE